MNRIKVYGIKHAFLATALAASTSVVNANIQINLTPCKTKKMNELGLSAQEFAFLNEYTKLVNKFQDLNGNFDLAKTYQHFELADNEVLHETTDLKLKILTARVVDIIDLPPTSIPAIFDDGGGDAIASRPMTWCFD